MRPTCWCWRLAAYLDCLQDPTGALQQAPMRSAVPGALDLLGFHLLFLGRDDHGSGRLYGHWTFHNTEANDPYFIAFWVLILMWTVVGGPWLYRRQRQASAQRA